VQLIYLTAALGSATLLIPAARVLPRRRRRHGTACTSTRFDTIPDTADLPVAAGDRPLDHRSVAAHFEATALRHPHRIAVRTGADTITYAELAIAARARALDLHDGDPARVALLTAEMSIDTVSTVLGLLSARMTMVALDPALPPARVDIITDILRAHGLIPVPVHPDAQPRKAPRPSALPPIDVHDVTSIQFTSGSTGTPKAVLHTNGLFLCDAQLLADRFAITPGCRVGLCLPISFGAGLNVTIGSLLAGAEIITIDPRAGSAHDALDRLADTGAQVIIATPAFLDALRAAASGRTLASVNRIVTTGEPAHLRHITAARAVAPAAVFTNWVGSSEASSIATYDIAPGDPLPDGVVPAGKPAPHKHIDIGVDGIVSITSPYLARGYLDRSAVTSRFDRNTDGSSTFTGADLGRWDTSGNLVLVGRADDAVKIRGYLVEPAEIEAALLRYPDIREAVVLTTTSEHTALAAYVAPDPDTRAPAVAQLRTRLHHDLPPWMVPADIVIMTELPRTERGKVDRSALPAPQKTAYTPPAGEPELTLARLWQQLLRVPRVGRGDGFYALGGDSLTVTEMLTAVRREFAVALRHSDLACAPTLAAFSSVITAAQAGTTIRRRLNPTTVALRPQSSATTGAPLFCVAGAGASALCFVPLANRLDPATAVYAFAPHGLEHRALPDWTVTAAAHRHLADLRRIAPHGPYTLVGHSLGSHIALELAHLLAADGADIELLVMLDPFLPPRFAKTARQLLPDSAGPALDFTPAGLRQELRHQLSFPLAGLLSRHQRRRTVALEEVGTMAGYRYVPQPWAGRALVIQSHLNKDDPRLWQHILTGELTIRRISCDHNSIVREPHIGTVTAMIDALRTPSAGSAEPQIGDDAVVIRPR